MRYSKLLSDCSEAQMVHSCVGHPNVPNMSVLCNRAQNHASTVQRATTHETSSKFSVLSLMLSLFVNRTDQSMALSVRSKESPIVDSGAHEMSAPCSSCTKLVVSIASSSFIAQPPRLDTRVRGTLLIGWPPTVCTGKLSLAVPVVGCYCSSLRQ